MAATLLLALALAAAQAGEYERERGTGTLIITPASNAVKKFEIMTVGANGHTCSLNGTIKGNIGTQNKAAPDDAECRITFTQRGGMVELATHTPEACMEFCGVRASFEGTYYLPPPACTTTASRQTKDDFLKLYKARNYAQAYAMLNDWYGKCAHLLFWVEADRTLNDLALAQYHMKQPAACLATLAKTAAAEMKTMKAVESSLPPADYDAYASTAKATFHNMELCGQ